MNSNTGGSHGSIIEGWKILVGNAAFEFYDKRRRLHPNSGKKSSESSQCIRRKISRHLKSIPENQNFSLLQKTLKNFKDCSGTSRNDKIIKLPTLIQIITAKIKNLFANRIFFFV